MPKEKPSQFLFMVHKDFKDRPPARVLRATFERTWKEKGWIEVAESKSAATSSGDNAGAVEDNK